MTLIGIATYGDHAEFITDTAWYTRYVEKLGVTTKHMTLNHLDAAVITGGDSEFGDYAQVSARKLADVCTSYDDLAARYAGTLRSILAESPQDADATPVTACLVGYSPEAGEFVIHLYAQEQDFKPVKVRQWLTPTPWTYRPSGIEARRVRRDMLAADESRASLWPQVDQLWKGKPTWTPPASVEEWVALATAAHEQRTADEYCQVLVLGSIVHTRLDRCSSTTRTVHHFEHTDQEFAAVMAGTRHPIGQMQACWCESGETFRDCHLRPYWADACGCWSGRTFYECCMVPSEVVSQRIEHYARMMHMTRTTIPSDAP